MIIKLKSNVQLNRSKEDYMENVSFNYNEVNFKVLLNENLRFRKKVFELQNELIILYKENILSYGHQTKNSVIYDKVNKCKNRAIELYEEIQAEQEKNEEEEKEESTERILKISVSNDGKWNLI